MNDLFLHDSLDTSPVVFSDRILYTPTSFAKTALLYLQEIGSLQAKKPHTSSRTHLSSYLFFCVNSGSGELEYQRKKYKLGRGDCVFIDNPTKQMFAIQACGMDAEGANRVPKKNQDDRYEIKSKDLVRLIYQSCGWDRPRSYRLPGVEYPQQRLVNYELCHAIPIFEGKMDKENESTQEPAQAASETEKF